MYHLFSETDLLAAITAIEAEIGTALENDPKDQLGDTVPGWFDSFRSRISERIVNVQGQLGECTPTAVELLSFTARPLGSAILVECETATEVDNLGFHLYRNASTRPQDPSGLAPTPLVQRTGEAPSRWRLLPRCQTFQVWYRGCCWTPRASTFGIPIWLQGAPQCLLLQLDCVL